MYTIISKRELEGLRARIEELKHSRNWWQKQTHKVDDQLRVSSVRRSALIAELEAEQKKAHNLHKMCAQLSLAFAEDPGGEIVSVDLVCAAKALRLYRKHLEEQRAAKEKAKDERGSDCQESGGQDTGDPQQGGVITSVLWVRSNGHPVETRRLVQS